MVLDVEKVYQPFLTLLSLLKNPCYDILFKFQRFFNHENFNLAQQRFDVAKKRLAHKIIQNLKVRY